MQVDGGIIDLFPAEPVIADPSIDHDGSCRFAKLVLFSLDRVRAR